VNVVSPGSILFEGGGWDTRRRTEPEQFAAYERNGFPEGRLGTPEEVADVDGIRVLANRQVLTLNRADAAGRLEEAQRRMLDSVPAHDFAGRSAEEIAPLSLPWMAPAEPCHP
jgi:hypothetical protein